MATAAVDVLFLSGHLGLPTSTLSDLISQSPADLVATILNAVVKKAREFDNLYSEKLKVDIELENAVHSAETRCQSFKATAEKALKDVEGLRQQLKEEGRH
jgi:nucleoprotein TPR